MIKKLLNLVTIILLSQFCVSVFAVEPFRFALLTDLHISNKKPQNEEDLKNAVKDVNSQHNIDFVLINGDDTDLGDLESFKIVKKIIDKLKIPYYISVGNHDTNSGETGLANFTSVFGDDTFSFVQHGFRFIGFPTSPLKRGEKAHITEDNLQFVKHELKKTGKKKSVILMTHYPMLKGDVDNWKDLHKILKKYNVTAILGGHYHRNVVLNYDEIPGIVNRSILRNNESLGGYTLYTVSDSLKVSEKVIGKPERLWLTLPLKN